MGSCALANCSKDNQPIQINKRPSISGLKISIINNTNIISSQSTITNQTGTPLHPNRFLFGSSVPKSTARSPTFNKISFHSVSDFEKCNDIIYQDQFRLFFNGLCTKTAQNVTIKQYRNLPEEINNEIIKRFPELYSLNNPNIIQVFHLYDYNTIPKEEFYVIYESFSKNSLAYTMKEFGTLNEKIIQSYTKKVLAALKYLHDKDIVHKNITPSNIFVIGNNVKISDGILDGIIIGDGTDQKGKEINPYLKEYIKDQADVVLDKSFDFWCLGCTLIELLTARDPWQLGSTLTSKHKPLISLSNMNTNPVPLFPDEASDIFKDFLLILFDSSKTHSSEIFDILNDSPFLTCEYKIEVNKNGKNLSNDLGGILQKKQIINVFNSNVTFTISESDNESKLMKSGLGSGSGIRGSLSRLFDTGKAFKSTNGNIVLGSLINKNNVIHELPAERGSESFSERCLKLKN